MKRSHKLLIPQHHPHKAYRGEDKVFRITRVKRDELSQYRTCSSPKESELIMTEEQLSRMTPKQQYTRFQEQAYEIKQLRRKLRKFSQISQKPLEEEILEAKEALKGIEFELSDQHLIIDNMIEALKIGALMPNTLQYDRLCSIIRNSMNLEVKTKAGTHISLPDKEIPITEKEQRHYVRLPQNSSLLRVLVGELPQSAKEEEQRSEVENYLAIHAELIRNMSFKEFVAVVKRER